MNNRFMGTREAAERWGVTQATVRGWCAKEKGNGKGIEQDKPENDLGAGKWLAEKFTGNEEIKAAAQFIRDCALSQAIA